MASPNYTPGVGALATNRYDFESHIDGLAFRHNAIQIDVNPAVVIDGVSYITVADALYAISGFVSQTENAGQGFIVAPDGYDTYVNASGNPNYDPTVPSLDTFLNPLFTYILNYYNNPNATNLAAIPQQYLRIKDGGVVLIKAGTYTIKNTVVVPPGITIMGENFGTKIINQTSSQAPLFKILPDVSNVSGTRLTDYGVDAVNPDHLMFARSTQFVNLMIGDNFIEPINSGDVSYLAPKNTVQPLILVEEGASLVCNAVKFIGKTTYVAGNISAVSAMPVMTDSTIPSTTGTSLSITNCIIDGFAEAAQFTPMGSAINSYFTFKDNAVRVYGFLNQNGSTTISSLSNGQTLPQSTINVLSTTGFPSTGGRIIIKIGSSYQFVSYGGTTSTTFTGCAGGNGGTLSTSDAVLNLLDNCFLIVNNANIDASNNYCYGDKNNVAAFMYVNKGATDAVANNYPQMVVSTNSFSIDRTSGSSNFAFFGNSIDSSIGGGFTGLKFCSTVANNNNSSGDNPGLLFNVVSGGSNGTSQFIFGPGNTNSQYQLFIDENTMFLGQDVLGLTFTDVNDPIIISVAETASTPNAITIIGQTTTNASTQGGAIVLQGGTGGGGAANGEIGLIGGSIALSTGPASLGGNVNIAASTLIVNPWQGTPAGGSPSPSKTANYYGVVLGTFGTGSTQLFSFSLPTSGTAALVEVQFIARVVPATGVFYVQKNVYSFFNNAGSVTPATVGQVYTSGAGVSTGTAVSGTTCIINAFGVSATTLQWEAIINVLIN